ncbi:ATP-binding protein [Paraliomyxa miuraensis]|uniref:ATP-binding protein n=1 Tax=Paraliomyxa miuraensis TaxID=376150 RepID=UPI00225B56BD|nr:ATP-binding protein [Paraliomyxa miuraensis]MCX4241239.1 ATP-binding protein [Paraliomyxa miuraensis]
MKWLLALEVQRTAGRRDQWRASTELLSELVAQRGLVHGTAPRHHDQPEDTSWIHLEKLSAMGIVEAIEEEGFASEGWQLTPLGEALLEEVAKGPEDPIGVLAQAIHEDELMVVVESRASAPTQTNEHVGAMLLHARMVAHEVRNALGPVQHASRALRSTVRDDTALTNAVELLDAIDRGVNRLHRFVTEAVRLVPPESRRVEPFSVLDAIADARKELGPDGVGSLNVETVPASADPLCHGNRGHFVLAMLNVLRNAQQAKGPDVRIAIRVDARNSSQVLLTIDDDGPGVPDAVREHIFENGVSYRQDGTGHGLASLRAVVEDIGGKVRCTTSELGGARFEIMLPAAEDSP